MKQFYPVTRLSNGIRDERSEAIFLCSGEKFSDVGSRFV